MSIAIGAICIFTIITLRDEMLIRAKKREYERLQDHFRPHEEASYLDAPKRPYEKEESI